MSDPSVVATKALPASVSVLVVTAHPDDAVLSMGGTLLVLARNGASIVHLSLTRGELGAELGGNPRVKEVETIFDRYVSPSMSGGRVRLLFGDLPDGAIPGTGAPLGELCDLLDREWGTSPFDLAFLHGPHDIHVDHINAHLIGHRLARNVDSILYFDSWSSRRFVPRLHVDVTDVWSLRIGMLGLLASHPQRLAQRKVELRAELLGTNSRASRAGQPIYAETFDIERAQATILAHCLATAQTR